jgi:hypothetical protein
MRNRPADTFNVELETLRTRIFPLTRFLHALALTLDRPTMVWEDHVFRYKEPHLVHFCLLRGVRIVSALNASIHLARCGFPQEIVVLLRTVAEFVSQIDFVLASRDNEGNLSVEASTFISAFFEDSRRPSAPEGKRVKLAQKRVHTIIGEHLDKAVGFEPGSRPRKPASQLKSNVYLNFSNYVHGRYPESMDLYGGTPGRFHLTGMRGTPKDRENIEMLDSLITSASHCFYGLVQGLSLHSLLNGDSLLLDWYWRGPSGSTA